MSNWRCVESEEQREKKVITRTDELPLPASHTHSR
jgi:hypothetical protein